MSKNRRLWPGYIPPQEDELFTSWLMRLCENHEYKSHSFSNFYFDGISLWNRDLDREGTNRLKELICYHTFLEPENVEQLFLKSFEGTLITKVVSNGPCRAILPLGIRHRERKLFGQLYCPGCLDSETPYYRKTWRLAFNVMCTKCGFHLYDRCPRCSSPVAFHRLENGHKNDFLKLKLSQCFNCKFDLRNSGLVVKNKDVIDYQKYVDSYSMSISVGDDDYFGPELYLKFLTLLTQPRGGDNNFRSFFKLKNGVSNSTVNPYSNIQIRLDLLPIIHCQLGTINDLKAFMENNKINKSQLSQILHDEDNLYSKL